MKGLLKQIVVAAGIFFSTQAYCYSYESVEYANECADCCSYGFMGLYFAIDGGYSWYDFTLHQPVDGIFPLNRTKQRFREWVPFIAVGYDLYPSRKIPLRFEVNATYADIDFKIDPLFNSDLAPDMFAEDDFRFINAMGTVYLDWHTCTRFVPYMGISAGYIETVSGHDPALRFDPNDIPVFQHTQHAFTYGGTIGTRFFFTNHVIGNLQLKFTDLQGVVFTNPRGLDFADGHEYSSDYLHETTLMLGLAYEF